MAINYESTRQTLAACRSRGSSAWCSPRRAASTAPTATTSSTRTRTSIRCRCTRARASCPKSSCSTQQDVDVIILRLATVCGVSPRMRFDLMVNTMTACATAQGAIRVSGAKQWRPHLHVQDAAEAFRVAVEAPATREKIFNVGSDEQNFTVGEIAEQVAERIPATQIEYAPNGHDLRSYRVTLRSHPRRCSASARERPSMTRSPRSAACCRAARVRGFPPRAVPQRQVAERERDGCKEPREVGARLRVGLIGCGRIARVHRAYLQGIASGRAGRRLRRRRRRRASAFAQEADAARRSRRVAELRRARAAGRGARADAAGDARAAGDGAAARRRQRAGREADGAQHGRGGPGDRRGAAQPAAGSRSTTTAGSIRSSSRPRRSSPAAASAAWSASTSSRAPRPARPTSRRARAPTGARGCRAGCSTTWRRIRST